MGYSRFAICEPTILTPTAKDVITALRKVYEVFHSLPDVIRVDRGTQFTSDDFCRTALALQSRIVESPVDTSWTNGKSKDYIGSSTSESEQTMTKDWQTNVGTFKEMINQITREYNTTPSENLKRSPHEAIFTFRAFLYPELKPYRRETVTDVLNDEPPQRGILDQNKEPKVGQIYKVRRKRTISLSSSLLSILHDKRFPSPH